MRLHLQELKVQSLVTTLFNGDFHLKQKEQTNVGSGCPQFCDSERGTDCFTADTKENPCPSPSSSPSPSPSPGPDTKPVPPTPTPTPTPTPKPKKPN